MSKPLSDMEQTALALADFFTHEATPDADKACALAAGILAARTRGQRGEQAFAGHVQSLAASLAKNSGALSDQPETKSH